MAYQFKGGEVGIVGKLNAIHDYNQAFPQALNYMTQGALSPEGFQVWNAERTSKLGGGGRVGQATFKVGRSGGVSLYGFGQWPVTLYAEQWEKLFGVPAEQWKTLPASVGADLLKYMASNPTTEHPATPAKPATAKRPAIEAMPAITATIKRRAVLA